MIILGTDLETSGFDKNNDKVIELGAVLWCTKTHRPLMMYSDLVKTEGLVVSETITDITGITNEDLDKYGVDVKVALTKFKEMAEKADCIVAHNGNSFDKGFFDVLWEKNPELKVNKPWVDTMIDIPYPQKCTSKKLTHLAIDHGITNPFAHRALFDILVMLSITDHYDMDEVLKSSLEPKIRLLAKVEAKDRELPKKEGFRWNPERKLWYKDVKASEMVNKEYPFQVFHE